jgi:hypothetical protein
MDCYTEKTLMNPEETMIQSPKISHIQKHAKIWTGGNLITEAFHRSNT